MLPNSTFNSILGPLFSGLFMGETSQFSNSPPCTTNTSIFNVSFDSNEYKIINTSSKNKKIDKNTTRNPLETLPLLLPSLDHFGLLTHPFLSQISQFLSQTIYSRPFPITPHQYRVKRVFISGFGL